MAPPRGKKGSVDFAKMYGAGENPNGYRAITPNGVASDTGDGFNQDPWRYNMQVDGERFNGPASSPMQERSTRRSGPTPRGKANRTAE